MEQSGELLTQKSNRLRDYLEQTQILHEMIADKRPEEVNLEEMEACLERRASLISEMDRIDGLLPVEEEADEDTKNRQWLCRRLLEQIRSLEQDNAQLLDAVYAAYSKQMRETSNSIRSVKAYTQQGAGGYTTEWEK